MAGRRGAADEAGLLLRLHPRDEPWWPVVRAALAVVGLPAALLEAEAGGPAFRIGGRRLARLAELVGDRPPTAPVDLWP
ncbi:hypothetical protein [Micromonospora sp. RL09-050-HVF-A]|uniref:hypothetical protein n=1 Tax=Micromonospora sp. RL09-050-HVF-A TaxID=1703433 RepID=UPI00210849F3|nr:hypothetical protein [Micromonospora sp. RL09-050-HVF-A]